MASAELRKLSRDEGSAAPLGSEWSMWGGGRYRAFLHLPNLCLMMPKDIATHSLRISAGIHSILKNIVCVLQQS